jgi:hypothetical protein
VYRFSDNLEFVTVRFRLFKQIGSGSLPREEKDFAVWTPVAVELRIDVQL